MLTPGLIRDLLAALIAGGVFLLNYNLLGLDLIISLIVTAGSFVGGLVAFSKDGIELQMEKFGMDSEYVKNALKEGEAKLLVIRKLGAEIEDAQVDSVVEAIEALFESIRKDPRHFRNVRKAFTVFLDMTVNAFTSYKEIYLSDVESDENRQTLKSARETFVELEALFRRANEKVLEQHFDELGTEVDLMKKLIKTEGL